MKPLDEIKNQLRSGNFQLTRHALKRQVERNISRAEIMEAGAIAEMIEDYPDDKYSLSSLLLGFTHKNRALRMQVSRIDDSFVKIITVYEPDGEQWIDFRKRC